MKCCSSGNKKMNSSELEVVNKVVCTYKVFLGNQNPNKYESEPQKNINIT